MINKLRKYFGTGRGVSGGLLGGLLWLSMAHADNAVLEQGRQAYSRGEFAAAIELWRPLAEQGNAEAQFAMGTVFYTGSGVAPDYAESSYWYHRSAEQGFAAAQYNLGNAYKRGEGVNQNDRMAVNWWQKAADQGFAPAQFNLASAYHEGVGILQDDERAMALYQQAAENGHQAAIELLARLRADKAIAQPGCPDWLAQQPEGFYTVQLTSTSIKEGAEKLAGKHGLEGHHICTYRHKGEIRYALILGAYPDMAAAQQAVGNLPSELRQSNPWIRRIGAIRQIVSENQP
jgi:TPR repeat protein